MTHSVDDRSEDYLWDRSGPPPTEIAELERRLGSLAFDPLTHPLSLQPKKSMRASPARQFLMWGALAASLLLAAMVWYYDWRLDWPTDRAWSVRSPEQSANRTNSLVVGQSLAVAASTPALIDVARLGTIHAAPGTQLTLTATEAGRHRLSLTRGRVNVRLWAPPFTVAFQTPAGDVIDLGCTFQLAVDPQGVVLLSVETGWVQLENAQGQSQIPAGASGTMQASDMPSVPVFDDASTQFIEAVRNLERRGGDGLSPSDLAARLAQARPRDVLTLLTLARRQHGALRAQLVDQAAALAPPPASVDLDRVRADDDVGLGRWRDALPLPPVKGWWRNWRDGLPLLNSGK